MGKIVVIGSANTDLVVKTDRMPSPGETILGGSFMMSGGGTGANQAGAAARLGGEVTFVARVGNDLFGERALAGYRAERLDVRHVTRDATVPSGVALICVDGAAENSIVVAPGANERLSPEDVDRAEAEIAAADFVARADAAFGDCGLKADALAGQVRVSARYESGRVQTLRLGRREVSGTAARRACSLRSANFSVVVQGGEVIFAVRGYGHGVGMSQRGADALAAAGRGYAEILAHYYTGTMLADAGDFLPEG